VAKVSYVSSWYYNKVVLNSYEAIDRIDAKQPVPSSGGTLVVTGTVNQVRTATLDPGWYRVDMRAGSGGNGGKTTYAPLSGSGAIGESETFSFIANNRIDIIYGLGGDGEDGHNGDGSNGTSCGGGCTGGSSIIVFSLFYKLVMGGSGGGGVGDGQGGGGGGGGGYGTGGNGNDYGGGFGGFGGSNGVGGNGNGRGEQARKGGGGGSGYLRGGNGYRAGKDGGGYGESGGAGAAGTSLEPEAPGGSGGASKKVRQEEFRLSETYTISYQGGGGAGDGIAGSAGKYGDGGGGLKSTSSGYLRIYRLA
jgi:hypothetical protein